MPDRSSPDARSPPEGTALDLPESGTVEKLVLSRGNLFLVTTPRGEILPAGARDLGLFREDTRHLSHLELRSSGGPLVLIVGRGDLERPRPDGLHPHRS